MPKNSKVDKKQHKKLMALILLSFTLISRISYAELNKDEARFLQLRTICVRSFKDANQMDQSSHGQMDNLRVVREAMSEILPRIDATLLAFKLYDTSNSKEYAESLIRSYIGQNIQFIDFRLTHINDLLPVSPTPFLVSQFEKTKDTLYKLKDYYQSI